MSPLAASPGFDTRAGARLSLRDAYTGEQLAETTISR